MPLKGPALADDSAGHAKESQGSALTTLTPYACMVGFPGLLPISRLERPPSTTATPAALMGKEALEGSSPSQMTCRLHARESEDPARAPQLSWVCTVKLSSASPHARDALSRQALPAGS